MAPWDERLPLDAQAKQAQILGQDPQIQKLMAILGNAGKLGGNMAPQGPTTTPGRPGGLPPQMMTPPKINFSTLGAGGQMAPPAPPPAPSSYQMPESSAMMSKLDPKGAATYSAIQGISNMLGQWNQKKEAKEQQYAANVAQNLVAAIKSGDQAEITAILTDPKSTKVLDKVYKGWLTKAQESQKPGKPPDPIVTSFENGVAKANELYDKHTGQQQQQQQPQQQQMPRQIGGYLLPQALPEELLRAATVNARLQQAQKDPDTLLQSQLTGDERARVERFATMLEVSPKEAAMLDAQEMRTLTQAYAKIVTEDQKQTAITKRIMDMTGMTVAGRKDVAKIQTGSAERRTAATNATRKAIAEIVAQTAKDKKDGKNDPNKLNLAATKAQISSLTSMKDNANNNYQKAVDNKNDDAAKMFRQQIDMLDGQLSKANKDLEDLKSASDNAYMDKMMQFVMSGGDEPDASDDTDDSN
jgi:hypothetical protein